MRTFVGYMPQEAYLSNTSLGINVSLETDQSEADVMQAIRMAELEADIGQWESGLYEEVGETGVNLSGGQKQRVNLARAFYSGRDYLVLDDPLSAVDTDTEAALMQSLLTGPEGFLLCSHRLSELQQTDRLLVLDEGRIIEDGDPKVLMNNPNSEFNQHLRAGDFEEESKNEL
jgi:ATP-binding cassette subfamily B protein